MNYGKGMSELRTWLFVQKSEENNNFKKGDQVIFENKNFNSHPLSIKLKT